MNSCHVTIPYTYEQVRSKCKCSGNWGADGLAPSIPVRGCEYSYSSGGASSYLGGNIGGCTAYIWFNNLAINFISKWLSLSINIETCAMSGIVIVIPDIPVTIMLNQLTLKHLNICHATGVEEDPMATQDIQCLQRGGGVALIQTK